MSEQQLDDLIRELQGSPLDLYSFVAENTEDLSDDELDALVEELEGDTLSLREFVIHSLED